MWSFISSGVSFSGRPSTVKLAANSRLVKDLRVVDFNREARRQMRISSCFRTRPLHLASVRAG